MGQRAKSWESTGYLVDGWNKSTPSDISWTIENDPCPEGYHVPTLDQFISLLTNTNISYSDKGTNWSASNYGYLILTSKTAPSITLEFPAVGYRSHTSGALGTPGTTGYYWSSTQYDSDYGYRMYFSNNSITPSSKYEKKLGHNIRCVRNN